MWIYIASVAIQRVRLALNSYQLLRNKNRVPYRHTVLFYMSY
jgi:hypothetical protein